MSATPHGPAEPDIGHLDPFPDPSRNPDEATWFRVLALSGVSYFLGLPLRCPRDHCDCREGVHRAAQPLSEIKGLRAPDMLIAFNADPDACARRNAYVISEQGKPPDFVMEVASSSTGRIDVRDKPADYAALGIPEYWRFDETGESYGTRLAGDRLVGDRYKPIAIAKLPKGNLEGYSHALGLKLRWEKGQLKCYDPTTTKPIMSLAEMQRIAEENRHGPTGGRRRLDAEQRAEEAERREETERQARLAAERIVAERIRELEAKLHRHAS